MNVILIASVILVLRIGQDVLFLAKIDAFNRDNRFYAITVNFLEAVYGITVIKVILDLMETSGWYAVIFGAGSILGGLIVSRVKRRLDDRLEGQRKFFARISLEEDIDRTELINLLKERRFEFTMANREYLDGRRKTVIEGSLENRARMHELKDILRGRKGKHVTIFRAEDVYLMH